MTTANIRFSLVLATFVAGGGSWILYENERSSVDRCIPSLSRCPEANYVPALIVGVLAGIFLLALLMSVVMQPMQTVATPQPKTQNDPTP